jgi:hypothetical protein
MSEKISLEKFKAWLEGVEEMQPEDWHPDATQWKKIREKIDLINDVKTVAQAPVSTPQIQHRTVHQPVVVEDIDIIPSTQSRLSKEPPPEYGRPRGPVGGFDPNGPPVKTPIIDTSDKPYSSSFA